MKIAVASGKGGTGKTLVAVNLAAVLAPERPTALIDCDVEAPNDHLFVNPTLGAPEPVSKRVPVIDEQRCTLCGACSEACEFGAIAVIRDRVMVFDELCHGCGRCGLVCPSEAIREVDHPLGVIERGTAGDMTFGHGRLHIGEAMASPIIAELKRTTPERDRIILDAPPGTACPVITTLHGVDGVLLVTEPTPFGLHDLRAAVGVVRTLGLPAGVVINREGTGDEDVERYCEEERLPIFLRIPFDRRIAEAGAEGRVLVDVLPEWRPRFVELAERAEELGT
jgi:MinD superfamily P-loop ATPase